MAVQELIKLRKPARGDLRVILDIENRSFKDPYPLSLLYHLYDTDSEGFVVAELGNKIVGYVIGTIRWGNTGHILAIAVDPPYRRRGIGTALMAAILDKLKRRGAKLIRLEVRKSNEGARCFYSKLGFKEREEVPFYYEDGETAVIMTNES